MTNNVYVVYMDDYEHYKILGIYNYLTDALKLSNMFAKEHNLERVKDDMIENHMIWENDYMFIGIEDIPLNKELI